MSIQHCVSMIYIYFFVLYFIGFLTILTYDGEIHLLTYLLNEGSTPANSRSLFIAYVEQL